MNRASHLRLLAILTLAASTAQAQKWVNPNFPAHRLDYRDLGYPGANEIEADNSPITALLAHSNGKIYGATSGHQSYLFLYDPAINKVRPLGKLQDAPGVHHCLVEGKDGALYIGTGLNPLAQIPLTREFAGGERAIETQLWEDIRAPYRDYAGGHLVRYDPARGDAQAYLLDDPCPVQDLGVPTPNNSVHALALAPDGLSLVGITYPDAHLFTYDLAARNAVDHGELLARKCYSGPERTWRSVPRALTHAPQGRLYTSGDDGLIVEIDPATGKVAPTTMRLPGEYWESWNYSGYPVVEQFVPVAGGMIFGGTSDGFLFRIDPRTATIVNLGKPRVSRRMRAMALGHDERLYFVCGEFEEPCKLYSYDIGGGHGFASLGVLGVDRSPYYAKRPYQFDAMATGADGTLFLGESDRRAKLFLYLPGAPLFPGDLNPTNPR